MDRAPGALPGLAGTARARIVNGARGLTAEQSDTFGVYAAVRKPSSQNDLGK